MNDKQLVAHYAAQKIQKHMLVGLGTGSTANYFIEALAQRNTEEDLNIKTVSSSVVSSIIAQSLGLPVLALEHITQCDIYVDGADEVSSDMTLLKGRGSDLVREKLLAKASSAFWVLIDPSKRVSRIGQNFPIPLEVMPFAWQMVQRSVSLIGGKAQLRTNGNGLAITSYGSLVLDATFPAEIDSLSLDEQLNAIPGIIEHGIFSGLAKLIICGDEGEIREQRPE